MEPATLGRVAVPPDPTPIQEGQTRLGKCSVSFAITLPSNAIGEAPSESSRQAAAEKFDSQCSLRARGAARRLRGRHRKPLWSAAEFEFSFGPKSDLLRSTVNVAMLRGYRCRYNPISCWPVPIEFGSQFTGTPFRSYPAVRRNRQGL